MPFFGIVNLQFNTAAAQFLVIIKGIVLHLYAQFAYRTLLLYILTAVLVRFLAL